MESKVSRRLQQPTAQEVCDHIYLPRLNREFASGFTYLTDINAAHLLMLRKAGLVPTNVAALLARTLVKMQGDGPDAVTLDPQREDAYFNYEAQLMSLAGSDVVGVCTWLAAVTTFLRPTTGCERETSGSMCWMR